MLEANENMVDLLKVARTADIFLGNVKEMEAEVNEIIQQSNIGKYIEKWGAEILQVSCEKASACF